VSFGAEPPSLREKADPSLLTMTDHHEDVCSVLFAYIDLLRTTPPSEWAFKEVAALSSLAFRYKEKSPPTTTSMHLALTMSRPFPREKLLSAPWKSTEWNPRIIRELVEERMRPEECRIMIASQEPVEGRTYDLKEKWYGTEYTIVPLSEKLLEVSRLSPSDSSVPPS
jgi:insulysin